MSDLRLSTHTHTLIKIGASHYHYDNTIDIIGSQEEKKSNGLVVLSFRDKKPIARVEKIKFRSHGSIVNRPITWISCPSAWVSPSRTVSLGPGHHCIVLASSTCNKVEVSC